MSRASLKAPYRRGFGALRGPEGPERCGEAGLAGDRETRERPDASQGPGAL
jgi:hypothetical protein